MFILLSVNFDLGWDQEWILGEFEGIIVITVMLTLHMILFLLHTCFCTSYTIQAFTPSFYPLLFSFSVKIYIIHYGELPF